MVFCYQNYSDLLWEKIVLVMEKNFFMLHPHENQSKFLGQQGWVEILMIILFSNPKQQLRKQMQHSIPPYWKQKSKHRNSKFTEAFYTILYIYALNWFLLRYCKKGTQNNKKMALQEDHVDPSLTMIYDITLRFLLNKQAELSEQV